jgi:hypothetical protein
MVPTGCDIRMSKKLIMTSEMQTIAVILKPMMVVGRRNESEGR